MLHFFRKIRRDLLSNSQFFKYLKYAIGEIILVVLGILIALYINNQNEIKKEQEKFDEVLVQVEQELVVNINNGRGAIGFFAFRDSILLKIVVDTLKIEDYVGEMPTHLQFLISSSQFIDIKEDYFNKLLQINNLTYKQDSILNDLRIHQVEGKRYLENTTQFIKNRQMDNMELVFESDWVSSWLFGDLDDKRLVDYYFNNSDYKKWASVQLFIEGAHLRRLMLYDRSGIEEYLKIHKYLENIGKINHPDSLQFEYNPDDYKHYLGKYEGIWCSDKDFVYDDSIAVTLEEGKLIYNGYPDTRLEIVPINKYRFRTKRSSGIYHLEFDKEGEVSGMRYSGVPMLWIYSMKKVR